MDIKPRFTRAAADLWDDIPKPMQFRLLNDVYCTGCRTAVGMLDHRGQVEEGLLVLSGRCNNCGEAVTRAVEPQQ